MNPHPYQLEAANLVRDSFKSGKKRVIVCLPTGGGKTVLFSYIIRLALIRSKGRVLILTDRKELLNQAHVTLGRFGIKAGLLTAKASTGDDFECRIAMVETFSNRVTKNSDLLDFSMVIIDECHKGNFRKVLGMLRPQTYVLGMTATPLSSKKQFPLKDLYEDIICTIDIPDLVKKGFLVPAITYSAKIDRSELKIKSGEFTDESQLKTFDKREVFEGMIAKWETFANGRKTICFCVNIEHSKSVCADLKEKGIPCAHIDGTTPDPERDQTLKDFKEGKIQWLVNVGIVTTGYDEPSVSCIIIDRATTSMPLYLQMCGRGSRLHEGKNNFVILDMGENYRHLSGTWDTPRDWPGIFLNPKKANEGLAPVKKCPQCEAIIRASLMQCPYCEHTITPKEQEAINKDIEFELIQSGKLKKPTRIPLEKPRKEQWASLPIEQICELVKSGTYHPFWAARVIKDRNPIQSRQVEEIKQFANQMGYKDGWVNKAMNF